MGGKILGNSGHMNNPDLSLGGGKGRGEEGKRKKKTKRKIKEIWSFWRLSELCAFLQGFGGL